jgi:hypothetical protein
MSEAKNRSAATHGACIRCRYVMSNCELSNAKMSTVLALSWQPPAGLSRCPLQVVGDSLGSLGYVDQVR